MVAPPQKIHSAGVSAETYGTEVTLTKREKRQSKSSKEDYLLSHLVFGDIYGWKAKPIRLMSQWGWWGQMYDALIDIPPERGETQPRLRVSMTPTMVGTRRPAGLTRETVEKAFGEGAWEVLNRGLVYLGDLTNLASSRTSKNFGST